MAKIFPEYKEFIKPRRKVKRVFIHCSANSNPNWGVEECWKFHTSPKPQGRGWADIGYHFYIERDGKTYHGRSLEKIPASQRGYNTGTIAICLDGAQHGTDDFTEKQMDAVKKLVHDIDKAYEGKVSFHGHSEVSSKNCPAFNYVKVLSLGPRGGYNGGVPTRKKLEDADSRTAKATKKVDDVAIGTGVVSGVGLANKVINPEPSTFEKAKEVVADASAWHSVATKANSLFNWALDHWFVIGLIVAGVLIYQNRKVIRARLDDESKIKRLLHKVTDA